MGYLSCNAESAIATCDSYNWELLPRKKQHHRSSRPYSIVEFDYSVLHSATNGFSQENLLGKGSHGFVYKATLREMKLVAAVKITKQNHPTTSSAAADNEVEILSRIYHPRLVNLLGFAIEPERHRKLIVVQHMPNGSLHELLHGLGKPPSWVKRTRFMLQIARVVQFLHESEPPIIHRDIKSTNVLIDSSFNSRLSDFGLAIRGHVEDVRMRSTPPAGTLGYLDPGYLAPCDLSTRSDVFSFGILMMEIISGRKAIDVSYSPPSVVDWASPAIKSGDYGGVCDPRIGLPGDSEALRRMAVLAVRCVRSKAERRPGMAEVVECLKGVYGRTKRRSRGCVSLGRHVGRAVEYEALEENVEVVRHGSRIGCRRNGKVSSVAGVGLWNDAIGRRVVRSKSIGTASEIKLLPSQDVSGERRVGLGMKMPTVSKSRSMGILQSKRMVNNSIGNGSRKLEESKLLADLRENVKRERDES